MSPRGGSGGRGVSLHAAGVLAHPVPLTSDCSRQRTLPRRRGSIGRWQAHAIMRSWLASEIRCKAK
eukprot:12728553-Prorocentrum_lima.AAC.1